MTKERIEKELSKVEAQIESLQAKKKDCLLYTSDAADE